MRLARVVATQDPGASGVFTATALPGASVPTYWRVEFFNQANAGLGVITGSVSSLTVAGHSLGGHLSTAFQRLFPGTNAEVLTVNGMGTGDNALVNLKFLPAQSECSLYFR